MAWLEVHLDSVRSNYLLKTQLQNISKQFHGSRKGYHSPCCEDGLTLVVTVSLLLSLIAFFVMFKNEVCFAVIRVKFCCVTHASCYTCFDVMRVKSLYSRKV